MPTLKIDNRRIEVPAGTKVIEAAERLGIMIPRFCFHPALGSAGACRVCGVAFLEGPIKGIQMSCMVNAMDGMVVSTTDAQAVDFRRHVIEWLMLNHPHDCPVCDEGGHCLLQDTTVSGGHGLRRYQGTKRTHQDQYLGPLVQHEMNRCIQCYRCSRYYQQYAGYRDLGVMGIGTRVYFGRSKPGRLESPFAGNLIDICPTGVYTDKPSRFFGRRWDFQRSPCVCLHCSLGCNLVVSARYREVVRHEARPNMDVNGYFICDRGRFGYPYANAANRPRGAMVKGKVTPVAAALAIAGQRLQEITTRLGPQSVAVVGSTRSSLETLAVLGAICREKSWTGPVFQSESRKAVNLHVAVRHLSADLALSLGAVSVADTVVVIGADPINEAPMLALSLRQAQQKGGHVTVIDPRPIELPLGFEHWPVDPARLGAAIKGLINALETKDSLPTVPEGIAEGSGDGGVLDGDLRKLAEKLKRSRRTAIVCGTDITIRQDIELAAALAHALRAVDTQAKLFFILDGPNALAAGLLLDAPLSVEQIIDGIEAGQIKAMVVVENNLWVSFADRKRLIGAFDRLDLLIVLDQRISPILERADIFLPAQTIYEAGGRWINQEGRLQAVRPVYAGGEPVALTGNLNHPPRVFEQAVPGGSPQAAWRLAAAMTASGDVSAEPKSDAFLGRAMDRAGTRWGELRPGQRIDLQTAAGTSTASVEISASNDPQMPADAIILMLVEWIFGTEELSADAAALSAVASPPVAAMHSRTAHALGFAGGEKIVIGTRQGQVELPLKLDDRMAPGLIVVPRHHLLPWQILGGTRMILDRSQVGALQRELLR